MCERQSDFVGQLMIALRWALNHVQPPFDFGEYRKAAELLGDTFVPGPVLDTEDDVCRTCGASYVDGGDGYDGECPSCADRSYAVDLVDELEGEVLEHKREIENLVIDIEKVLKGETLSDNALNNLHLIQAQINEFRELKRNERSS